MIKIRIKFRKYGVMRFIGHLDIMRYFQKAMRRAEIDICYSEGFSPHQIMSFAAPLGVGITSDGEYLDIEVNSTRSSEASIKALNDTMVEGVHFSFNYMAPYDVGYRLMTANLSDIAAMGGIPRQVVLSVAASGHIDTRILDEIYRGIKDQCQRYHVNLIGGDTVSIDGPMVWTITIIGEVPKGKAILRSGARPGDVVGVTNYIGYAATGLGSLSYNLDGYPMTRIGHQRPEPQIELGQSLRELGIHSMNDISDGLSSELNEIAKASHVSIVIDESLIPLHEETYKLAVISGTIVSVIAFIMFQVFPRNIISIFGNGTKEYYQFATNYFRIFLFMTFANAIQPITSTFCTAIGKAMKGTFLALTRQIIFLLPLIVVLPMIFGINGIMYAAPIADGGAAVISIIVIRGIFRKMGE